MWCARIAHVDPRAGLFRRNGPRILGALAVERIPTLYRVLE
jgi:hypothetical protein